MNLTGISCHWFGANLVEVSQERCLLAGFGRFKVQLFDFFVRNVCDRSMLVHGFFLFFASVLACLG